MPLLERLIQSLVLTTGVCLSNHTASAAPFSFAEPFNAPPLTPGTENSIPGDWEDGFVNRDNGWLVMEAPGTGNSFGQRDATGLTPGDHFDQILNARTRNGAAAFAVRDLTETPLSSGAVTVDITNVLPGLGTPRFQLRLANSSGALDGLILQFGELDAADNNKFDVNQVTAFGTFVATVADTNTTTTTLAPLAWNAVLGNTTAGDYVSLQVDFSTILGTASVVVTTTDHLGASSSTAPVALNFVNALPLGVERMSLQMLAPGNAHPNGGLAYLDNYSITGILEPAGQGVIIVSETGPLPSIVKGPGIDTAEAADELADYLSRVSGRTIEVLSSPVGTGAVIHVGNDSFAQTHAPEIAGLYADGFVMKHVEVGDVEHLVLGGHLGAEGSRTLRRNEYPAPLLPVGWLGSPVLYPTQRRVPGIPAGGRDIPGRLHRECRGPGPRQFRGRAVSHRPHGRGLELFPDPRPEQIVSR